MTYTAEDEPTLVSGCMGTAVFATPLDLATIYFIHQTDSFVPTSILHINPHTHNYNSVENVKVKGCNKTAKTLSDPSEILEYATMLLFSLRDY